jgi:hypothetical protein
MRLLTNSFVRRPSRVASLALVLIAIAGIATPVSAATPPTSDYGNTAECRYRAPGNGPAYNWRLSRLVVKPPVLYAKKRSQQVGWRFAVNRSIWADGQPGPLKVTYRSPIQKRTATPTNAANFTTQDVDVALPNGVSERDVEYTVTLKLFWYRSDGSIGSRDTYLMPWMKLVHNGTYYDGDYSHSCWGGFYEGP